MPQMEFLGPYSIGRTTKKTSESHFPRQGTYSMLMSQAHKPSYVAATLQSLHENLSALEPGASWRVSVRGKYALAAWLILFAKHDPTWSARFDMDFWAAALDHLPAVVNVYAIDNDGLGAGESGQAAQQLNERQSRVQSFLEQLCNEVFELTPSAALSTPIGPQGPINFVSGKKHRRVNLSAKSQYFMLFVKTEPGAHYVSAPAHTADVVMHFDFDAPGCPIFFELPVGFSQFLSEGYLHFFHLEPALEQAVAGCAEERINLISAFMNVMNWHRLMQLGLQRGNPTRFQANQLRLFKEFFSGDFPLSYPFIWDRLTDGSLYCDFASHLLCAAEHSEGSAQRDIKQFILSFAQQITAYGTQQPVPPTLSASSPSSTSSASLASSVSSPDEAQLQAVSPAITANGAVESPSKPREEPAAPITQIQQILQDALRNTYSTMMFIQAQQDPNAIRRWWRRRAHYFYKPMKNELDAPAQLSQSQSNPHPEADVSQPVVLSQTAALGGGEEKTLVL